MQFQFVFKLFHDCGLFLVAIPYISLKKEATVDLLTSNRFTRFWRMFAKAFCK